MACGVALKRPYDYDEYLSAEGAGEAKRARHTQAHCSPFRAQIGTIAASLPVGSSSSSALLQLRDAKEREDNDVSPFASIAGRAQLSSGQLESYLRAEIRYLKRRHLIPRRKLNELACQGEVERMAGDGDGGPPTKQPSLSDDDRPGSIKPTGSTAYRVAPNSPSANDKILATVWPLAAEILTEENREQSPRLIRYLKRRHLIPRRKLNELACQGEVERMAGDGDGGPPTKQPSLSDDDRPGSIKPTGSTAYRVAPNSPSANSGSDSDGESSLVVADSNCSQKIVTSLSLYDKPQFSLKQDKILATVWPLAAEILTEENREQSPRLVQMICERLLKQQEVRLRYEYETVLNQRLEEQHEQYVQFAREQLERQHEASNVDISYLS
ncbi:Akirin [Toxocara canis]|uniref:Akirin n=1 Tax=Toxocara canis TaxID=6265 RepID=A0A0B2UVY7_TOXCA|nr:Akirin [Toxocara canis]